MIGVGAGLGDYTTEGGYLYPDAKVVRIDINPRGLWQGLRTADLHLRADALAARRGDHRAAAGARRRAAHRASAAARWRGDRRRRARQQGVPRRPRARSTRASVLRTRRGRAEGLGG